MQCIETKQYISRCVKDYHELKTVHLCFVVHRLKCEKNQMDWNLDSSAEMAYIFYGRIRPLQLCFLVGMSATPRSP